MKQSLVILIVLSLFSQIALTHDEYKNSKGQSLDFESVGICQRQCSLELLGVPQYADQDRTVFRCCQKINFMAKSECHKVVATICENGNISKASKVAMNAKIPAIHKKSDKPLKSINL